jgi:hypothetical protein
MSDVMKKESRDEAKIGIYAAKQPLSGTNTVSDMRVKGFNGASFLRVGETKKAV